MSTSLTRGEREDLLRLIRSRERVAKAAAAERAAQLRADFETQLDKCYDFNTNAVWAAAVKATNAVAREMQEKIAAECERLGIPRQFAPSRGCKPKPPKIPSTPTFRFSMVGARF